MVGIGNSIKKHSCEDGQVAREAVFVFVFKAGNVLGYGKERSRRGLVRGWVMSSEGRSDWGSE